MSNALNNTNVVESNDSHKTSSLPMVMHIHINDTVNTVAVTGREISNGNYAVTISYITIADYLRSQANDDVNIADLFIANEKAQVLASVFNSDDVEFVKLDGSSMIMYSSGIHTREYMLGKTSTGLMYRTITWYSEPSKTKLNAASAEANADVLAFLQGKEQLADQLKAKLAAKTAK